MKKITCLLLLTFIIQFGYSQRRSTPKTKFELGLVSSFEAYLNNFNYYTFDKVKLRHSINYGVAFNYQFNKRFKVGLEFNLFKHDYLFTGGDRGYLMYVPKPDRIFETTNQSIGVKGIYIVPVNKKVNLNLSAGVRRRISKEIIMTEDIEDCFDHVTEHDRTFISNSSIDAGLEIQYHFSSKLSAAGSINLHQWLGGDNVPDYGWMGSISCNTGVYYSF